LNIITCHKASSAIAEPNAIARFLRMVARNNRLRVIVEQDSGHQVIIHDLLSEWLGVRMGEIGKI
jgi:hypothetical protein